MSVENTISLIMALIYYKLNSRLRNSICPKKPESRFIAVLGFLHLCKSSNFKRIPSCPPLKIVSINNANCTNQEKPY